MFKKEKTSSALINDKLPYVTIQLPIYNEGELVVGLLKSITTLDYPKELLQIQILDDSTDNTLEFSEALLRQYKTAGFDIALHHRTDRTGYKAGALKAVMPLAKGSLIAIFDADFRPNTDFLKVNIPFFNAPDIGVVQTKWGHINYDYSLLTKLQAFQLDIHFGIEQKGREKGGHFLQFNGTCGIWRKSCIIDAGGWEGDTLTEDLDLSYRAQLKGWKIHFNENHTVPGLLPYNIKSLKSQQFRWMKGGAQNAIKHCKKILKSPISFKHKYFCIHHLSGSFVFIAVVLAAITSLPLSIFKDLLPVNFDYGAIFLTPLISIILIYFIGNKNKIKIHVFVLRFFQFLSMSMGISLYNSKGILEAIMGKKSAFIKTDKEVSNANKNKTPWFALLELTFGLYFCYGVYHSFTEGNIFLITYFSLLAVGFISISTYSLQYKKQKRRLFDK